MVNERIRKLLARLVVPSIDWKCGHSGFVHEKYGEVLFFCIDTNREIALWLYTDGMVYEEGKITIATYYNEIKGIVDRYKLPDIMRFNKQFRQDMGMTVPMKLLDNSEKILVFQIPLPVYLDFFFGFQSWDAYETEVNEVDGKIKISKGLK